jgi:hypothetical protein
MHDEEFSLTPIDVFTILIILFRPFGFIAPKTFNYLSFQSCDFERHLMKVILEACRAH